MGDEGADIGGREFRQYDFADRAAEMVGEKAAKARRVDSKKARSSIKAGRGRVRGTD